jgi:hypothetical protein
MFSVDYVVINELIKFIWTKAQLNNSLNMHVKENKTSIQQKDMNFWKLGTNLIIQKSITICWFNFL